MYWFHPKGTFKIDKNKIFESICNSLLNNTFPQRNHESALKSFQFEIRLIFTEIIANNNKFNQVV